MKCVKVPFLQAQKVKKYLGDNNLVDKEYSPQKNRTHLFFPLKKQDKNILNKFKDTEIVDREFTKKQKRSYKNLLPRDIREKLPSSYDMLGDIIIIEIPEELQKYEKKIASALLKTHNSVNTILKKAGIHSGEFRTRALEYLAGEKKKETIFKENNCRIMLDVEEVYFSPRLSTERKRIFKKVKKGEEILVMFSGCGPYPLSISKNTQAKHITAIEKNPLAHEYAEKNLQINKVQDIELIKGDVREVVPKLKRKFDRIIMPLPKDADTFLDLAFLVSKKGTVIHLYDFEHESEIGQVREKIDNEAKKARIDYKILEIVKCGQYSPGKFRICADFEIA